MWFNSTLFESLNSMNVDHIHPLSKPIQQLASLLSLSEHIHTNAHAQARLDRGTKHTLFILREM